MFMDSFVNSINPYNKSLVISGIKYSPATLMDPQFLVLISNYLAIIENRDI